MLSDENDYDGIRGISKGRMFIFLLCLSAFLIGCGQSCGKDVFGGIEVPVDDCQVTSVSGSSGNKTVTERCTPQMDDQCKYSWVLEVDDSDGDDVVLLKITLSGTGTKPGSFTLTAPDGRTANAGSGTNTSPWTIIVKSLNDSTKGKNELNGLWQLVVHGDGASSCSGFTIDSATYEYQD